MVIKKGSLLTRAWHVEWHGIEFSEMRSSIRVDGSTISTQVAAKESGVHIHRPACSVPFTL